MSVYKISNGVEVKVSASEAKKTIMKANNWNETEYRKNYDLFKNKLRAYEVMMEKVTGKAEKQSPADVLYKQAMAINRAKKSGETYNMSNTMKQIMKMPALSITKGRKAVESKSYMERRAKQYGSIADKQFENFVKANPQAQAIADAIEDPIRRAQALAAYADKLHVAIDEAAESAAQQAIPIGESIGSDLALDFDISNYLDEANE